MPICVMCVTIFLLCFAPAFDVSSKNDPATGKSRPLIAITAKAHASGFARCLPIPHYRLIIGKYSDAA
jgi:hypothetical protein